MTHHIPELLSPAGSLEKLKVVLSYGANAVYLGGQKYGLREAGDNFSDEELREGIGFAHSRGAKAYVVLNAFLHDSDFRELPKFLRFLEELKVDAVIVSDMGVIATVKEYSNLNIHLSTQASCLNSEAALWYRRLGVKRIILGREADIGEAEKIKKMSGLEIEMFIHGSMCSAYSGNCVISNYTRGRDANRGGCAHSCRLEYNLSSKENQTQAFFMSSRDLNGLRLIPQLAKAGIDSVKVEGRMKGHYYGGVVTKIYAQALNIYHRQGLLSLDQLRLWEEELDKVSHRSYYEGGLNTSTRQDQTIITTYDKRLHQESEYMVAGVVIESVLSKHLLVQAKNGFPVDAELELIPFEGGSISLYNVVARTLSDERCSFVRPGMLFKLPPMIQAAPYNVLRTKAL